MLVQHKTRLSEELCFKTVTFNFIITFFSLFEHYAFKCFINLSALVMPRKEILFRIFLEDEMVVPPPTSPAHPSCGVKVFGAMGCHERRR